MSDHARLSPSNQRWPHCPGSVREEAEYPDTPGRAAIDGTGTHLLLELCLLDECSPYDYEGETIGMEHEDMPLGWIVERDRCDRVQMALDYIERRRGELEAEHPGCTVKVYSESKSNPGGKFDPAREDWWGTCDITIEVQKVDGCPVFFETADYKDGRGYVPVENNTQLLSYAIGKLPARQEERLLIKGIRTSIIQPRTSPVIRYEDLSADQVHKEALDLKAKADATDDPEAPLYAGWWCQWCLANPKNGGHCTKPAQQAKQEIQMTTDTNTGLEGLLDLDVTTASEDQLAKIMDQKPLIDAAFERVEQEIQHRLEQEIDVPGWAMKPGRNKREWSDEDDVMEVLKSTSLRMDDFAPRKLISPAQAEKIVSKRTFNGKLSELITETPGKLKPKRVSHDKPEKDADTVFGDTNQSAPSFL